uniref:Phosphatidylinositol-5-phosphate 4-kinase type 2 alpha n=1 Tax=Eptatretus burgeri TaxID=7764 RepID=A0A8C4Q6A6_EPTBU
MTEDAQSINELIHVPQPVMLLPDDFKAYSKIKVNNHLFNKENMPSHFKLKEYCPLVFRNLRERFCIDDLDYQVCGCEWSRNQCRFDLQVVPGKMYFLVHPQYIVECHGNTLLPQFLGMYRLTVDGVETYMVVTHNVFSRRLPVHQKYDLKGSTVDRMASGKEKTKELPTLKDNDFLNDGRKIVIGDVNKQLFLDKLARDVEFLTNLKIMDYSLLVGIHDVDHTANEEEEEEDEEENRDKSSFQEVYFMAIIDILTHYDTRKKAAHAAKTVKHGAGAEISTVNPEQYGKRFLDFVNEIVM